MTADCPVEKVILKIKTISLKVLKVFFYSYLHVQFHFECS